MSKFKIEVFGITDVGLQREKNEDHFALFEDEGIFILADGMGGHNSGQVASRLAVQNVTTFLRETRHQPGAQWPYPSRADRDFYENSVDVAIKYANERIFIESMKKSEYEGMGTTLLVALDADENVVLGHVGDSRIYRFAGGKLEQVTEDHSLLNHMIKTKQLDPSKARDFKNKNIIVRAIGLKDYVEVDVITLPKRNADCYLMCSDGLSDLVEDWIIAEVLGGEEPMHEKAKTLVRLANQSGGKDNITVILFKVVDAQIQEKSRPVLRPVEMLERKKRSEENLQRIESQLKSNPMPFFNDITAAVNLDDLDMEQIDSLEDTFTDDDDVPNHGSSGGTSVGIDLGAALEEQLQSVSSVDDLSDPGNAESFFDYAANPKFTIEEKKQLSRPDRFMTSVDELMYLEAVFGGVVIPELFE
ncbi:MAG: Stp1/IreP family PP2C-type Ser/Thr phosphatase [Myxococcales bacterium]|nr:Stp1/IreP family PP2C-type Ser/Thr phosphatase [Myxococcales bacterium]